jgi:hypothetical protein
LEGCGRSDAAQITKVLDRCAEISHQAARYNGDLGRQANFVATEFQNVDVSSCPADFRMAFQAHVFAWQQAEPALAQNTVGNNILEGVIAGATDNPRLIGGVSGQASMARQQINATYLELTQIAARYGARIPASVVGR